ncbi:MAG: glycosyltransferase family 1 protein [Gammaproteobacteria bacterium]|nr:glycosyltransferase family 1 protein [Gammaproteobacteria bacterium]
MNLLLVTETYPPEINGVARTLAQMVKGLSELGHAVTLVRPAQKAASIHADGDIDENEVPGLPIPGYPGLQFGLPAYRRITRLLDRQGIDAAYIATEGPLGYSALKACRKRGIPALTGMHTNFHQYSSHYGASLLASGLLRYLRRFHNEAAGTLVPTVSMRNALAEDGFLNLHTWPRGVHTDLFTPARRDPQLREAWGIGPDGLAVLYVGRLAPEKNIDLAFSAFDAIRARRADASFVLVGSGPAEDRLKITHPDALFCGPRQGCDLARHYASADIFLFPSETETFGNVTLEAMASGLAVVSYDLAAAHELILHGHSGLLAEAGSTWRFTELAVACARNPELQRTLKRHARETALQQDWPKLLVRLEQLFLAIREERVTDGIESPAESTERS